MKTHFVIFLSIFFTFFNIYADFEMQIVINDDPYITDEFYLQNRQKKYYWNNDIFEVAAFGFTTTSNIISPKGFLGLNKDQLGATLYRFPHGKDCANSWRKQIDFLPMEKTSVNQIASQRLKIKKEGTFPYPLFPHIVIKEKPDYGLLYPDTKRYAPPVSESDIDPVTGALAKQSDYYDSTVSIASDDASLLLDITKQHPTQFLIGIPYMPPNTKVNDAIDSGDVYKINTVGQGVINSSLGFFCALNGPDGEGLSYGHTHGSGPGGLMAGMALSWGQEFFGFDMRCLIAKACKESGLFLFHDSSGGMQKWKWAGNMLASGDGPYQIQVINFQQAIQSFPDYYSHNESYKYVEGSINVPPECTGNIVIATTSCYLVIASRYYGYFSAARALRIDDFAKNAADPFALVRIVTYGFNRGPHIGDVWNLAYGANRKQALKSKNLAKYNNLCGVHGYTPRIIDLMRRIGTAQKIYDETIIWGDILDFLSDIRTIHYSNGIPSISHWQEMTNELKTAFDKMKGKAPTLNLGKEEISFRYNWMTLIRIMKRYLPCSGLNISKGNMANKGIEFFDTYMPSGNIEETKANLPDTNYAPEIYWITPNYSQSSPINTSFPIIKGGLRNIDSIEISADILDDYVGVGKLQVRYTISSRDSSNGGYSYWLDGDKTGNTEAIPIAVDWIAMDSVGESKSLLGGKRFMAIANMSNLKNEIQRIYIEANDNCGYRTISWVDVLIKNNKLKKLTLKANPVDSTSFTDSLSISLSTNNVSDSIKIFFTTDDSQPDTNDISQLYNKTFVIFANTTVKAMATGIGFMSATGLWEYFLKNENEIENKTETKYLITPLNPFTIKKQMPEITIDNFDKSQIDYIIKSGWMPITIEFFGDFALDTNAIEITTDIYDPVANLVTSSENSNNIRIFYEKGNNQITAFVLWNCKNNRQRTVSNGTYLAYFGIIINGNRFNEKLFLALLPKQ